MFKSHDIFTSSATPTSVDDTQSTSTFSQAAEHSTPSFFTQTNQPPALLKQASPLSKANYINSRPATFFDLNEVKSTLSKNLQNPVDILLPPYSGRKTIKKWLFCKNLAMVAILLRQAKSLPLPLENTILTLQQINAIFNYDKQKATKTIKHSGNHLSRDLIEVPLQYTDYFIGYDVSSKTLTVARQFVEYVLQHSNQNLLDKVLQAFQSNERGQLILSTLSEIHVQDETPAPRSRKRKRTLQKSEGTPPAKKYKSIVSMLNSPTHVFATALAPPDLNKLLPYISSLARLTYLLKQQEEISTDEEVFKDEKISLSYLQIAKTIQAVFNSYPEFNPLQTEQYYHDKIIECVKSTPPLQGVILSEDRVTIRKEFLKQFEPELLARMQTVFEQLPIVQTIKASLPPPPSLPSPPFLAPEISSAPALPVFVKTETAGAEETMPPPQDHFFCLDFLSEQGYATGASTNYQSALHAAYVSSFLPRDFNLHPPVQTSSVLQFTLYAPPTSVIPFITAPTHNPGMFSPAPGSRPVEPLAAGRPLLPKGSF